MLAPFAPHMTEELWEKLGHGASVHKSNYPVLDETVLKEENTVYPISVNGKKRAMAEFPNEADVKFLENAALENEEVQKWISGQKVKKVIVVPGRMINIVV